MTEAAPAVQAVPLTVDEIMSMISDIARHGDGPERFRALKMLASMNSTAAVIPEPLTQDELIDRLAVLMRGAGGIPTQIAYKRAFPYKKSLIAECQPQLEEAHVKIDYAHLPRTLKALYQRFPHARRPGRPKGYPKGSFALKEEWVRREAVKLILEEQQRAIDQPDRRAPVAQTEEAAAQPLSVPDPGAATPGGSQVG